MTVAKTMFGLSVRDASALSLALVAVLIALWILIVALLKTIGLVEKPFPGVFANQRLVVTSVGFYDWTGSIAGLKYPDKIVAVDDTPVSSLEDLYKVVQAWEAGVEFYYTVKRGDETLDVEVPSMQFTWADYMLIYGLSIFVGFVYLLIGLLIFLMKFNSPMSRAFFSACCACPQQR